MTTCKLSGLYVLGKIGSLAYIHILYNKHVRIIIIPMRCAVLLHVEKFIWSWNVSYRLCTILNMHSYRTFALISKVFSQTLQGRDTTSKMVCSMTLLLHTLHFFSFSFFAYFLPSLSLFFFSSRIDKFPWFSFFLDMGRVWPGLPVVFTHWLSFRNWLESCGQG